MEETRPFAQWLKEDYNLGLIDYIEDTIRMWEHDVHTSNPMNDIETDITALLLLRSDGVLFFETDVRNLIGLPKEAYWLIPNAHQPFYHRQDSIIGKIGVRSDVLGSDGKPFFTKLAQEGEWSPLLPIHVPMLNRERDKTETFCIFLDLSRGTLNTAIAIEEKEAIEECYVLEGKYKTFWEDYNNKHSKAFAEQFGESLIYSYPLYFSDKYSLLTLNRFLSIVGEFNGQMITRETETFLKEHYPYKPECFEEMPDYVRGLYGISENKDSIEEGQDPCPTNLVNDPALFIVESRVESRVPYPISEVIGNSVRLNDTISNDLVRRRYLKTLEDYESKVIGKGKKYNGIKALADIHAHTKFYRVDDSGHLEEKEQESFEFSGEDKALIEALYKTLANGKPEVSLSNLYRIMVDDETARLTEKKREHLKARLRLFNTYLMSIDTSEMKRAKYVNIDNIELPMISVALIEKRKGKLSEKTETFVFVNGEPAIAKFARSFDGGLISAPKNNPELPSSVNKVDGIISLKSYAEGLRYQFNKELKCGQFRSLSLDNLIKQMGKENKTMNGTAKQRIRESIFKVFSMVFEESLYSLEWVKNPSSKALDTLKITKLSKTPKK